MEDTVRPSRPKSREWISDADVDRILGLQENFSRQRLRLETPGIGTKRIDLRLPKLPLGSSVSPFSNIANANFERALDAIEKGPERSKLPSSLLPSLPKAMPGQGLSSLPHGVAADFQHNLDEVLAIFEEVRRVREGRAGPRGALQPSGSQQSPPRTLQRDGPGTMSAPALHGRGSPMPRSLTRAAKPRSASPDLPGGAASPIPFATRRSSDGEFDGSFRYGGNVTKALERKLAELRANADERIALEERVEEYRRQRERELNFNPATGRESPNFLKQARQTASFLPEIRQRKHEQLSAAEAEKMARAREARAERQAEELRRKAQIVARWEEREDRLRRAEEIAAERAHLEQRQKRWAIVLAQVSRVVCLGATLDAERRRREAFAAYMRAIIRLQRWWKPKIARLRMHKRARALVSISHYFVPFLRRWRERRRKWASERLIKLIRWGAEKNTMLVLMKQFKARLARCVMIMWRHNLMIEAQTYGLARYWDRLEGFGGGGGGDGPATARGKKKKKGGLKKTKAGLVTVSGRVAVPEHIKAKILRRDLRERRRAFRKGPLAAWEKACEEWEAAHPDLAAALKAHAAAVRRLEKGEEAPPAPEVPEGQEPPRRPRFHVTPSEHAMKELIVMGRNEYRIEASVAANREDANDVKWESDSDTKSVRSVRSARSVKSTKSTKGR